MSDQTQPQPAPDAPVATQVTVIEVTEDATPMSVRAKTLAKTAFAKVGVPVLIGSAAAWVATRNCNVDDEEDSSSLDDTTSDSE